MQYDPIKRSVGKIFGQSATSRVFFFFLLDLLLLRSWHIRKELKRWNAPANPVALDAGSGFGQYTYRLLKLYPDILVKAIDVNEELVQDCNRFFLQRKLSDRVIFEKADLTHFVEPEQFDLIISIDVMEHIDNDVQVFKNFYTSMKEHGMLLISTPSDKGGSDVHDHEPDKTKSFIEEHVRDGYNMEEIRNKLKNAGFNEIHVRYQYGKPGSISWKLSMKYPIKMLGFSKMFFIILPFYYLLAFPIAALLNLFDLYGEHRSGTGLIVTAYK